MILEEVVKPIGELVLIYQKDLLGHNRKFFQFSASASSGQIAADSRIDPKDGGLSVEEGQPAWLERSC